MMDDSSESKPATTKEDVFERMRQRFADCEAAESSLRRDAIDDFRFIWEAGCQWDNHVGRLRGKRPKYEFNKLRQAVKQVINDMRMNTPAIKVRATEDGDVKLAEIRQGLIRNIETQSRADTVYDWGGLYAISSGFGAWRVTTQYVDDDCFDQEIRIQRIHNPFSVRFDPSSRELDRSDAHYVFIEERISKAEFQRRWPKAEVVSFDSTLTSGCDDWYRSGESADTEIRVVEYWEKKPTKREMLLLSDGRVVDADGFDEKAAAAPNDQAQQAPVTVVQRRTVDSHTVTMSIMSGKECLEGPFEWAGRYIPIIPVWGDFVHINGKDVWYGMARMGRDAQILYNFERSNFAEIIAKQPHAPFLATPKQTQGFEPEWTDLAVSNNALLPYNPDPQVPGGRPIREPPPQISPGYLTALQLSADDLKATTGIYDASLGKRSNETSGRAIMARQREGDVANYDYQDNIARAILYTGIIVNDLIPHIYDTERQIRIIGADESEDCIQINKPVWNPLKGTWETVNDLREGRYDVTIDTGPSYTTQRMETLDAMMQLAQANGPDSMLARYGVLKAMDTPGMDEVRDAYRQMLIKQGLLQPGEKDAPVAPPGPDPAMQADMEKNAAQTELVKAQTQGQQLQNALAAQQMHMNLGTPPPGMPPPGPSQHVQDTQPPQGGFFMPADPREHPEGPNGIATNP